MFHKTEQKPAEESCEAMDADNSENAGGLANGVKEEAVEEKEALVSEGEQTVATDEAQNEQGQKYWSAVNDNPQDFTSWTYLLQFVEQEVSNYRLWSLQQHTDFSSSRERESA